MNPQDAAYSLSKQLPSIDYIQTGYGKLELTPEMTKSIQKALTPILSKIANQVSPETVSQKASHPEHYSKSHSNHMNWAAYCKSCGKQFSPFEIATDRLFPVDHPDRGLCSDCYEKQLQAKGQS